MVIPHCLLEGGIGDLIGRGTVASAINSVRWELLRAATAVYDYRYTYYQPV